MFRSIQFRITISFVLIILVSVGILGFYLVNSFRDSQLDNLRIQLENEARIIAEASLPILTEPANQGSLDSLAKRLGEQIDAAYVDRYLGELLGNEDLSRYIL